MQHNKRALDEALVPYSPSVTRKVQRSDKRRMEPASAAVLRIIDTQALKIDQLEKEQIEYQKHMKAVQWAKMELQSATSANTRWKELCDQLQLQTEDASTANLMRERELYHTIAERNQQIVSLRVAQDQLREQLLQSQQQAIELQAQCDAFETQVANSERLVATARIPRADKHSTDNDRMQQQLQNSREKLAEAREGMLQAQRETEETKIQLRQAHLELEQAAADKRTQDFRQEHTNSLQEELSKARAELQELLQDNKTDEITRLQHELSRKTLECTKETARAEAAEGEVRQLLDVVPQRDALKDQVASLQHALNDMQSTTGAVDVREVLQRYQARELASEQVQEQLRTRIEQLEAQECELQKVVGSQKAKNKELQQKLMNSESSVERLQGLQRTSAGEISFLRARLDFHMTATATVAKWNAAKLSQAGESDATTGVSASESAMIEQKLTTATPELPPAAEMASLQKCLDDSRAQVDKLETSKKEVDDQLAAAEVARAEADMRVEQERKIVEQLKLALELQKLSAQAQAASIRTDANQTTLRIENSPDNMAKRELCEHQVSIIQQENERLRDQVMALTKAQAESSATAAHGKAKAGGQSHAVLSAQLAIVEQQVADFKNRVQKLSGFFSESMQGLRKATQEILGWDLTPHRTIGSNGVTYTLTYEARKDLTLTASHNQAGELELKLVDGSGSVSELNGSLSEFQKGDWSAPELFAHLLLDKVKQEAVVIQ